LDAFSSWPGFVPAIHVFFLLNVAKTWMPWHKAGHDKVIGREAFALPGISNTQGIQRRHFQSGAVTLLWPSRYASVAEQRDSKPSTGVAKAILT
jgi:hypothetical protein